MGAASKVRGVTLRGRGAHATTPARHLTATGTRGEGHARRRHAPPEQRKSIGTVHEEHINIYTRSAVV